MGRAARSAPHSAGSNELTEHHDPGDGIWDLHPDRSFPGIGAIRTDGTRMAIARSSDKRHDPSRLNSWRRYHLELSHDGASGPPD